MLAKPSALPDPVDPRLSALADAELSDRLVADHPQLFSAPYPVSTEPAQAPKAPPALVEESTTSDDLSRVLAIVGLLLAVVAAYALGLVMRARMNADVPPLISIVAPSHTVAIKRLALRHENLGPAAAAKLERALALVEVKRVSTVTRAMIAGPQPNLQARRPARAKLLAEKMHTLASPRFHEEVSEARAPALASSGATSNAATAASGSDTEGSSDAVGSIESGSPGRQVSHGPVWSENGPGSIVPGGIVLGRGRFPGGGGMPGGCPRSL